MQPDDVDGVTIIRGKARPSEVVLTLDPRGMRLTHPRRSWEYDVAWSDVEEMKVVTLRSAAFEATGGRPFAAFRLKPTNHGFLARLKRGLKAWDECVLGDFDPSPEELVDLIERYRLRHAGPEPQSRSATRA
jgi:hypothetical protein